jgi:glycine/D-amino acid oxidase-like deaminating enzyme
VVRAGPVGQPVPVRLLHTPDLSLRPHKDGQVHLEAPDAVVDLHTPEPELHRWATELLHRARRTIGTLDHAQITEHHVCVRPMPQDGHPIIGPLPGTPAVYVAVTHSGVTLAAHLSQLIAAELLTGTPQEDLAPYRPARFLAAAPPPAPSRPFGLRPPSASGPVRRAGPPSAP